jgi:hypothetical protein
VAGFYVPDFYQNSDGRILSATLLVAAAFAVNHSSKLAL